ncbi:MAG: prolyl oligopeptidase family serine peptidase [Candidatus Aegiribacteria sp.]|nr:prolyl oligopeptidase family serine peptidase [Candidatus Aegiribacteria sp.]MBD3295437.1 prolyl oligopeptidase family serine peptidase [Candidatus Fermentibacteria bacterium]
MLILYFVAVLAAVSQPQVYMEPDSELVEIVDVQWAPWARISPDSRYWLMVTPQRNPSIEELAREELKLAGMRFSPQTLAPTRSSRIVEMSLMSYPEFVSSEIQDMPRDPLILSTAWSPDGSMVAFTNETPQGIELWLVNVDEARARRLTGPVVSLTANEYPEWLSDGSGLLCCTVDQDIGPPPPEDPLPAGPVVQESSGEVAPARTYQDLLENPYQEDVFEYYLTSRLSIVSTEGDIRTLGDSGMYWYYSVSPDAEYLLVSQLQRPFSYSVTAGRFAEKIEVWDVRGNAVAEIASFGVRDDIPIAYGSTYEGPRSIGWRNDRDAQLYWVEALDGGDAGKDAEFRDRVFSLEEPFDEEPRAVMDLQSRYSGIMWGNDSLAIVSEWWWPTRNYKIWRIWPGDPDQEPQLLIDRSWEDRYNDPGSPMLTINSRGKAVLITSPDGSSIYLEGDGASPEGERPFVDRLDLTDLSKERLFRSQPPLYETPRSFIDDQCTRLLFTRESPSDYPNYFIRDVRDSTETQVTFYSNPLPMFEGVHKELITYQRDDGVSLSATLYLPPEHSPDDGPLPMVMWAYPQEFRSSAAAGQVAGSPYEYDYVGWWSPLVWLTQGYAVLDYPSMPIVGEGEEHPNDTFIPQLVMSAEAAVDEVVERGVADRDRIAIGGHSYGAFMTANLLAHSDLFATGIAQSGAYNRTLTPFGFQSEDRTLWEAMDVYVAMSPFMSADGLDEPILLIHGQEDSNSGTYPMQSERFYNALKGLGGRVRLVMLPLDSHGYRARESKLHVLWENQRWLEARIGVAH